jgi:hypothetical protein
VVFAALALSKHLFDIDLALRALAAFFVFCGLSGTVYLVNDVTDLEKDRLHPLKRLPTDRRGPAFRLRGADRGRRAGGSPAWQARSPIGPWFAAASLAYLLLNLAYSLRLKEIVILDALSVSLGFVLRAYAGGLAIRVAVSDWLVVCILLLALFLALAKRRHELVTLSDQAREHRAILAEYSPYLLDQMIGVVTASCVTAYAFYTLSPETHEKYQTNALSWTIPFVDLRGVPLSLPRAPARAGRQPDRHPDHGPAAAADRGAVGDHDRGHRLFGAGSPDAGRKVDA